MHISYVNETLDGLNRTELEVVDRIRRRRAPAPLQPLDLALLHSPPIADGWNSFLGSIRNGSSLNPTLRELLICRVAVCNSAWYEWEDHAPLAINAGLSVETLDIIRQKDLTSLGKEQRMLAGLGDTEWAALMMADEMTCNVRVRPETFHELQLYFGEREIVEVIATISCYNCVSRFLVALDGKFSLSANRGCCIFHVVTKRILTDLPLSRREE
jgi:alkylhydroperoxidase family enzyme